MTSTCSATIVFSPSTDTIMRKMVSELKESDDPVLCGLVYDHFLTSAIAVDRLFHADSQGEMELTPYAELVALEVTHLAHSTEQDVTKKMTQARALDVMRSAGFEAA
tara:strand:- start:3582 stop:3902 length:321 start_codon:yes stop_codon:yes gene_type:complete